MARVGSRTKCLGKVTLAITFLTVISLRNSFTGAMTATEQQEIIDIHNSLRRGEGSSNMNILTWSPALAIMAQNWTDRCVWQHGQGLNSSTLGDLKIGQNNFATSLPISLTAGVNAWFSEKADFFYSSNACGVGKVCGHYTQVVWADTYEVGCGYTVCPSLNKGDGTFWTNYAFLVCNYNPAGNIVGKLPYLKGPACSQCSSGKFFCNNGLCDRSCSTSGANCVCAAACKNCATVTSDCRCQCGVGWNGVDCSAVCNDTHVYCNPAPGVAGWPPSWCDPTRPYVIDACPKMCGLCVAGTPSACGTSAPGTSATRTTTGIATPVGTTGLFPTTRISALTQAATSRQPAASTSRTASTTRPPAPPTTRPSSTTRQPAPATKKTAPTTRAPAPATTKAASSTRPPTPSAAKAASTTRQPAPATTKAAPTTRAPAPATTKAASSTRPPTPSTAKAAPVTTGRIIG